MAETLGQAVLEVGLDTTRMEAGVKGISGTVAAASASLPPLVPRVDGTLAQTQFVTLQQQLQRNAAASPLLLPVGLQQQRVDALTKSNEAQALSFGALGKAALFAASSIGVFTSATEAASFGISQNVAYQDAAAAVETLGVNSTELGGRLRLLSSELNNNISTVDLLKASYDVASSGFAKTADAVDILKASALLATGGFTTIGVAADATTSVLNAYGLSSTTAAKLADGFIQTQNDGKIVVAQYAQEIGRVAPIAAAAGVSIEELNAAVSVATAQGVPVGSTFAGLRQAISSILKPTSEAKELAGQLGLAFNAQALKAQGLGQFLKNVEEKTGGAADALTKLFGPVEAIAAIQPLLNDGLVSYNRSLDAQVSKSGQAAEASEKASNTLSGSVKRLTNALSDLATQADKSLVPLSKLINLAAESTKSFKGLSSGIANAFSPLTLVTSQVEKLVNLLNKDPLLRKIIEAGGKFVGDTGKAVQDLGGPPASDVGSVKDMIAFERELAAIREKRAKDDAAREKGARFAAQAAERDIIRPAEEELRIAQRLFGLEGEQLRQAKQALEIEKLRTEERKKEREFKGLGGNAAVREGSGAAIEAKAQLEAAGINIRTEIVKGADELRKAGEEAGKKLESAAKSLQQANESLANAVAGNADIATDKAIGQARETLQGEIQRDIDSGLIDRQKLVNKFGGQFDNGDRIVTDSDGTIRNRQIAPQTLDLSSLSLEQLQEVASSTGALADANQAFNEAQKEQTKAIAENNRLLGIANERESNLAITVPVGESKNVSLP